MTNARLSATSEGYYQPIARRGRLLRAALTLRQAFGALWAAGDATIMTSGGDVTVFGTARVLTVYTDTY